MASVRTPAAAASATRTSGSRTPSERVVGVWRSTIDLPPAGAAGCPAPRADLGEALDALEGARPSGRRVDVDLGRVEDDRPLADLEPRRQRVDESRQDGFGVEADDAPDRARHPEVRLVGGPA